MAPLASDNYFFPGDYRNELRNWIKGNCLNPLSFLKFKIAKQRLLESVSRELAENKYQGDNLYLTIFEIQQCGKYGEKQRKKENEGMRYRGHYCNHRDVHIPCAIRYRNGQGVEMKNQEKQIIHANGLWGIFSQTYTLPQETRDWIDNHPDEAKPFLLDVRRVVADTFKENFGLNKKSRNIQPGFHVIYHPVSSSNPFKQASHFHVIGNPVLADLKTQKLIKLQRHIPHKHIKKIFKKHLDRVLLKHGVPEAIKPEYTVNIRYANWKDEARFNHVFKYTNRSQAEDLMDTVKHVRDDFSEFVCVLHDKEKNVYIPCVKTSDEILNALELILNPLIQIRMAYGFMRVLPKYSKLLGIERDDYEDDKNWEKVCDVDIRRETDNIYDLDKHKVVTRERVFVRNKGSTDPWEEIKPEELRGEYASMQDRKLYKAVR
ncbi:hypothetical protein ES703_10228 [subsurface metagenome]